MAWNRGIGNIGLSWPCNHPVINRRNKRLEPSTQLESRSPRKVSGGRTQVAADRRARFAGTSPRVFSRTRFCDWGSSVGGAAHLKRPQDNTARCLGGYVVSKHQACTVHPMRRVDVLRDGASLLVHCLSQQTCPFPHALRLITPADDLQNGYISAYTE